MAGYVIDRGNVWGIEVWRQGAAPVFSGTVILVSLHCTDFRHFTSQDKCVSCLASESQTPYGLNEILMTVLGALQPEERAWLNRQLSRRL